MSPTTLRCLFAAFAVLFAVHAPADDRDAAVLEAIRTGGVVVLVRHAITEPGIGDPPGFRIDDCRTQRNLSEQGREQSRRFGERLRGAGIDVAEVRSSHWCRCLDTARLAFGEAAVSAWQPLDSFFGGQGDRNAHTRDALAGLSELPADRSWVWVTHQVNITALTGEYVAMGEAVVARPRDGSLEVIGRWRP